MDLIKFVAWKMIILILVTAILIKIGAGWFALALILGYRICRNIRY